MFEDYYFTTSYDTYYPPAQAAAEALDRINGEYSLETYQELTELDVRAGISEFTSYVLNEYAQDPSDPGLSFVVSALNQVTPNFLTSLVYLAQDSQNLISDFLANNPDFQTTTSNVSDLIADAQEASRIGIGLDLVRPEDFPFTPVEIETFSFDFGDLFSDGYTDYNSDFGLAFDFSFDFNFDFDFNFESDFASTYGAGSDLLRFDFDFEFLSEDSLAG
jgi:hypothetical protein